MTARNKDMHSSTWQVTEDMKHEVGWGEQPQKPIAECEEWGMQRRIRGAVMYELEPRRSQQRRSTRNRP